MSFGIIRLEKSRGSLEMTHYEELKLLVERENERYHEFNNAVYRAENETELEQARSVKQAFVYSYAQRINDYLYHNLTELTAKDCTVLDLVPYLVWNQVTDKSAMMVEQIKLLK